MQDKSIAECSNRSILQYFWPSLSYHLSLRPLFCLFLSGSLRLILLYVSSSLVGGHRKHWIAHSLAFIRPHKKIPVFRVTRPYLNLLVKHRIFFRISGKNNLILCILKGNMPFKMYKIIYIFPEKKYVCLPYLKFSDPLPETTYFFIWPKPLISWLLDFVSRSWETSDMHTPS